MINSSGSLWEAAPYFYNVYFFIALICHISNQIRRKVNLKKKVSDFKFVLRLF